MTRILIILGLCCSSALFSQKTKFSEYNWNTFPALQESDTVKSSAGAIITLERKITEVYLNKEDFFEEIYVFHRKIRVESHDAINRFNKIYVPVSNVIEVLGIKARFVSANGKIIEVPEENIRQVENLDNKGDFRTFAIEGAEPGGEIEYYYTLRKKYNAYGSAILQGAEPRINMQIIYTFPKELEYLFKPYNGFPEFTISQDTITGNKCMQTFLAYVPGISEERYALYEPNLMRYEFTLTHNNYSGPLRIYSFSKVAGNMYNNVYLTTKAEDAAIKSTLKKLRITGKTDYEKVKTIENWLKGEIVVTSELPGTPPINETLKNKQTTEFGMTRLLVGFLKQISVDFEIVLTCDQSEKRFDPTFNGWNYLDDFVIYFPQFNAVILPHNPFYRLGLIPSDYQDAYGLFMQPFAYNNKLKTLAYEVKKLPKDNYLNNSDSLFVRLRLNTDQMNLEADIHRVFSGELASSYQSFWKLMPGERKDEVVAGLFSMGNQNTNIDSYKLTNSLPEDIGAKPLIWDINLKVNSLVEQAGEDILVRIGETIGEQVEMYQPGKRKLPVYVGSLHSYYRVIEFEIPEGYTLSNPENLLMNVEMIHNNRVSSAFTSNYELNGNKLVIQSREYYSELEYPLEQFEAFRKVINAAADFNKKTILLIKL